MFSEATGVGSKRLCHFEATPILLEKAYAECGEVVEFRLLDSGFGAGCYQFRLQSQRAAYLPLS